MTTVLVADDQPTVRRAFTAVLSAAPDLTVVGAAADGLEAVRLARQHVPDVALMDIRMPELNGIEAVRRIAGAGLPTRAIMITTFDLDDYVYDALAAGASGFLLKDVTAAELTAAVRVVAKGDALLAPRITRRLIAEFARRRPAPPPADLTPREAQVLRLVARGLSNAEIAAELVVTEHTVKTHVARMLTKLGLRDRAQAIVYAYETGLVLRNRSGSR
ncbi:response regulator [Thermoactinospora rubra]|uniref:response regulator n=1 Tax=Thermoactinospora rubra TaxID=1088767 RepID=UPI000A0FF39F|nr:response regulator transcription factor [Thermoactinospora rubra]